MQYKGSHKAAVGRLLFSSASAALAGCGLAAGIIPISLTTNTFDNLETIIFGITVGVGVMMIIFFGLKLLSSEEERDRTDAKRSMIQVGVGLLIIILAETLVSVFLTAPAGYS